MVITSHFEIFVGSHLNICLVFGIDIHVQSSLATASASQLVKSSRHGSSVRWAQTPFNESKSCFICRSCRSMKRLDNFWVEPLSWESFQGIRSLKWFMSRRVTIQSKIISRNWSELISCTKITSTLRLKLPSSSECLCPSQQLLIGPKPNDQMHNLGTNSAQTATAPSNEARNPTHWAAEQGWHHPWLWLLQGWWQKSDVPNDFQLISTFFQFFFSQSCLVAAMAIQSWDLKIEVSAQSPKIGCKCTKTEVWQTSHGSVWRMNTCYGFSTSAPAKFKLRPCTCVRLEASAIIAKSSLNVHLQQFFGFGSNKKTCN